MPGITAGQRVTAATWNNELRIGEGVAQLHRAAVQSITNNVANVISFDTAVLDKLGGWASSPNPTRYTPNVAGWYLVSGFVGYASNATGNRQAGIVKNGSIVNGSLGQVAALSSGTTRVTTATILVQMNGTTDFLELRAFQTSGASLNTFTTNGEPNMTVVYAGFP